MGDLYDDDEIKAITGLDQPAAQERWLNEKGLRAFRNRDNKVVLSREAFIRWQLGDKVKQAEPEPRLRPINGSKTPAGRHG